MKSDTYAGRHVLVTGGTGALGAAVVERLTALGATCHVPVRAPRGDAPSSDRVVRWPGIDLTDEGNVQRMYGQLPGLWASVHCAGGFDASPIDETSVEALDRMLSLNLRAAYLCCREAVRRMRALARSEGRSPEGRLVNVAAQQAVEPRRGSGATAYTVSKAGIAALTEALAEELAAEGIWVNAVAPSTLDTPANRRDIPGGDPSRWARVEDVAETIAFLASPSNRVARGSVVRVYGRS